MSDERHSAPKKQLCMTVAVMSTVFAFMGQEIVSMNVYKHV